MRNNGKCPVCGHHFEGLGQNIIYSLKMSLPEEYHLPNQFDIVSCGSCGFCFADTSATEADYDHYYENINFYAHKPETLAYSKVLERWVDIIRAMAEKSDFILDMGFGDGRLLLALKENGFHNLIGVDTTKDGVSILRKKGIEAYESSIYDDPVPEICEKADIMIMSGVFEHLLMPRTALSNARKWLKKGGKLFCLVPNMDNLAATKLPISYFFHHEHINYFTRDSLKYFMGKEGYKEIKAYPQFDDYGNLIAVFEYLGEEDCHEREDLSGCEKLRAYFDREGEKEKAKQQLIGRLVESREPLILYGCGSLLQKMWAETNLCEGNIVALVDKNPLKVRDMNVGGLGIISPEQLAERKIKGRICIFCAKGSESILQDIRALGISNEMIVI